MRYASKKGAGIAFRTLTAEQIKEIHSASCRILNEVGVIVHHDEAAELLKKAGAYTDAGGRTYLSDALVEWAIRTAPSRVTIYNRLGAPAMFLEDSNAYFGTGSDTLMYIDPAGGERRPWNREDVAAAVRLVDNLPQLDFVMSMGLLSDVDKRMIYREQYALMLKNSVKPQVIIAEDRSTVDDIFAMAAAVAGGKEKLMHQPLFALYTEPTSPLQLPFESVDKLLAAAEYKIPVNFACGALAGASTPVTVAGTVAQANAEALCGLVIHQLKNPGAPFLYGYGDSPLDMRTMQAIYAVPHALLLQGSLCDLARFYALPSWGYAGCSSSKMCDEQAVIEATMFTLMGALQGCNLMHDVFYIESGYTGSVELLVLTNEVISRVRNMLQGVDTSPEYMAVEAVKRVGPGGNFLGDEHTARHFRETWQPDLSDFNSYDAWAAAGAKSMGQRAREKARQIMATHQPVPVSAEAEQEIERILRDAEKRLCV
ncbi:trimethylamine methyltransferase family protein [Desulfotruncus alcoholivorax]|uniref:trimethylamine methyltransferase family protein n=1 Tax=Desulfotruncus alcoholivorax TaxID=265477 RepID=UPI0003F5CD75|nr:trimethylamine methyltransferase family protein [Desulfotruncus alcoholivorax]